MLHLRGTTSDDLRRLGSCQERLLVHRQPVVFVVLAMSSGHNTEVEDFRSSFLFPSEHEHLSDESLQAIIDGAKEWIAGRRLSWTYVASRYLRDGRYHA